ncbi:hypothetical protein B0A52_00538 [Exophiala mesophila]|uniref:Conserved oligomeric Golgi complex subunit 6 n=1 Tax=Exophiala mesophila TaxID=212818 RepID=A0A438NHI7_EXOME|nr:hypothetical protein B0A52_00538 [Exophiala mesophila]
MATTYLSHRDIFSPSTIDVSSSLGSSADATTAARKPNALGTKVTSVLSSSYADHEIRDALRLLDDRGLQNDQDTRRNLKTNAQKDVIDCNAKIVDDFGAVAEQLRRVGSLLNTLNTTVDSMRSHISAARQETAAVLEDAGELISRKQDTEAKSTLLTAFTSHFLISTTDLNLLTSSAEPLDDRFFEILTRVKHIHRDCEILLGYENQRLGLELMEQTTRNLDAAFKKLYTWIQREFKGLDLEDPHISSSIRRALRVLSERPTLFQNCLDFFAEARQSTLAEAFHAALTGSSGVAKAIEFSTHEPLRYIGDMLAWVHSTAVSEKEALEGLFISDADDISKALTTSKASEPWARIPRRRSSLGSSSSITTEGSGQEDGGKREPVFNPHAALASLISRNLSTACATLSSRIDVAVRNSGDPVLQFKTFNVLDFYRGIFTKLLGPEAALVRLIETLESNALAHFEDTIEEEIRAATSEIVINEDLSPPTYLATGLRQFAEICRARGPQMTDPELERIFTASLSGILNACAGTASSITNVRSSSIYRINYMTALKSTLSGLKIQVPNVGPPLEKASTEIQALRDGLVKELHCTFLEYSGVDEIMQELDSRQNAMARKEWLVDKLDGFAVRLDEFLSSALMDAQEALKRLLDRAIAQDVVAEAIDRFCADFDELEAMLEMVDVQTGSTIVGETRDAAKDGTGDAGSPELLRDLYPRTGAEVRALLT